MIILNIDFSKIDKDRLKRAGNSAYGDLVLIDHPSEHKGIKSDGFVKQGVTKEEREARVDMPILGNWRRVGGGPKPAERPAPRQAPKEAQSPGVDYEGKPLPF